MENTNIIKRLIQHYIEGSELTQDEHFEVRSLEKKLEAINYTHCCKSDSEQLLFSADEIVSKINEQTVLDGETFRNYFDKKKI